jgi:hypothetical protein
MKLSRWIIEAVSAYDGIPVTANQHRRTEKNEMICMHGQGLNRVRQLMSSLFFTRAGTVLGGGILTGLVVTVALTASVPCAWAGFGVLPGSFKTVAVNRDNTIDAQAGSHPYAYTVSFALNENAKGEAEGNLRDVVIDLPAGFIGNPRAVPRCSRQDFEGQQALCPGDTQVGVVHADVEGNLNVTDPVFNLVPPPGVPARLGFSTANFNGIEDVSVRTGSGYGVAATANNIPVTGVRSVSETIWGVPSDASHDPERACVEEKKGKKSVVQGCSSDISPRPFITLPTSCTGPLVSTVNADSTETPGEYVSEGALSLDAGGNPVGLFNCERLPFAPSIVAQPETGATSSPTGLRVDLHLPQNEEPQGLATADLKDAVFTFPQGMTVNPSAASGLAACTPSQIDLTGPGPATCPDASKIGTVEVDTPPIDHPLHGSVYIASQEDNPFHSLLAIYIAIYDPVTGVVVKLAGHVQADETVGPEEGRLKTTFDDNPQLPFEDLKLDLFGGSRAALSTPATCGTKTITTDLTPWTAPEAPDATPADSFDITQGCAAPGFSPSFTAGTLNPQAGASSTFVTTFSRHDGEQSFQGVEETLPPGLLATIKGIPLCGEAQANAGTCDPSSQIGEASAAAGEGEPFWVSGGKVYLTGPYGGGPFGLSIVVPAVAGPFNLGNQIVRAGIYIDPHTAQATIRTTTPIPHIIKGIPLYIRAIQANIDRSGFVFNPTNCSPTQVTATLASTVGTKADVAGPFEAANCASLPFKPSFKASTQGKTSKAAGASLTVDVSQKPGEANIHEVSLQLPLILPARLTTLQKACTAAQFEANPAGCPEGSNIGFATAITPVLGVPLIGPAYLVSHGGAAFPDVEFVLQGEGVQIVLDGKTDIKKGITYSKFETVPDAPISSFETVLPEGPHSALAANGNLCVPTKTVNVRKRITVHSHGHVKHRTKTVKKRVPQPLTIPTTLTGQNGATVTQSTKVAVTGCPKAKTSKAPTHNKK